MSNNIQSLCHQDLETRDPLEHKPPWTDQDHLADCQANREMETFLPLLWLGSPSEPINKDVPNKWSVPTFSEIPSSKTSSEYQLKKCTKSKRFNLSVLGECLPKKANACFGILFKIHPWWFGRFGISRSDGIVGHRGFCRSLPQRATATADPWGQDGRPFGWRRSGLGSQAALREEYRSPKRIQ